MSYTHSSLYTLPLHAATVKQISFASIDVSPLPRHAASFSGSALSVEQAGFASIDISPLPLAASFSGSALSVEQAGFARLFV